MEGALVAKQKVATKNKWKSKGNETNVRSTTRKGKKDGHQHCNKKSH